MYIISVVKGKCKETIYLPIECNQSVVCPSKFSDFPNYFLEIPSPMATSQRYQCQQDKQQPILTKSTFVVWDSAVKIEIENRNKKKLLT